MYFKSNIWRSAVLHTQWVCNTYLKVTVLLGPSPLLRLITYPLGPSRLLRGITYPLGPSPLLRLITYPLGPWPFRTGITYPLGPSLLHWKICEKNLVILYVSEFQNSSRFPNLYSATHYKQIYYASHIPYPSMNFYYNLTLKNKLFANFIILFYYGYCINT